MKILTRCALVMSNSSKSPAPVQPRTLRLPAGAAPRGVVARKSPSAIPAFWVIWASGRRGPRHRHPTQDSAMVEAQRLATLDPGRTFEVYGCLPAGSVTR